MNVASEEANKIFVLQTDFNTDEHWDKATEHEEIE